MNRTNDLFRDSAHVGAFNPFYFRNDAGKFVFGTSMEDILAKYPHPLKLNPAAISSVLNKAYVLGDITCVEGVFRTPWMAKPNESMDQWEYHKIPEHGVQEMTSRNIAKQLFELLVEEISTKIKGKRRVGLLLSGGMDSRFVAGILQYLRTSGKADAEKVVAYTWGNADSRDVVYAQRICDHFGWDFRHYPVSAEDLWENIRIAGERGCEFSGLHLHAMPKIAQDAATEVDIVLAGSYGDSIGRAEFSGKHVSRIGPIEKNWQNFAQLLPRRVHKKSVDQIQTEVKRYRSIFNRPLNYQMFEIEQQAHYMRRMLNPCMEIIHEKVPLYQAFSHPKVFGFMWSLRPDLRNDNVYKELLRLIDPYFARLPWARTGVVYGETGKPDSFKKKHHSYERYLQKELQTKIREAISGGECPVLNKQSVRELQKLVSRHQGNNFDYLEALAYVLSVLTFVKSGKLEVNAAAVTGMESFFQAMKLRMEYHLKREARKMKRKLQSV